MSDLKKIINEFELRKFSETFVKRAFEIAREKPTYEEFQDKTISYVSDVLELPREIVLAIHHPYHWSLLLEQENSPLEEIKPEKFNEKVRVKIKKEDYNFEDVICLVDFICNKYGFLIMEKVKNLNNLITKPKEDSGEYPSLKNS